MDVLEPIEPVEPVEPEPIGYVTLEYANEYVKGHFLSTDELRLAWERLTDDDKTVLLRRSFESLESLVFTGRKTCPLQPNAFPRYPECKIPDAIKAAQIENAVSLSDSSTSEDAAFYEKLWQFGVESYSIGNLSERTSSGAWGRGTTASHGVVSARASSLLQPYLAGGFKIRGSFR